MWFINFDSYNTHHGFCKCVLLLTKLGTGRIHRLYLNRGSFNAILRPKYSLRAILSKCTIIICNTNRSSRLRSIVLKPFLVFCSNGILIWKSIHQWIHFFDGNKCCLIYNNIKLCTIFSLFYKCNNILNVKQFSSVYFLMY